MRRTQIAATDTVSARNVPNLMATLKEAEIRARIKQARMIAGLDQGQLADLLRVHPRTINNYEGTETGGKSSRVPYERLGEIADITGVELKWLLHGDDQEVAQIADRLETFDQKLTALTERLDRILGNPADPVEPATVEQLVDAARATLATMETISAKLGQSLGRRDVRSRVARGPTTESQSALA